MTYILNTEISDKKNFSNSFKKIFGIGYKTANRIKQKFGLGNKLKIKDLNGDLKNKIINFVENNIIYGSDLKQNLIKNNENLIKKRCYRGFRLKYKLPRRGQRTHTNAKTTKNSKILK